MSDILSKILPNHENDLMLLKRYLDRLTFYEKEQGKWYLKSHDSDEREKLVLNENSGKSAPEEIVRQLFLYELSENYGYLQSEKWAHGVAFYSITQSDMGRFVVPVLPLNKQKLLVKELLKSESARTKSRQLLDQAKRAVELFIEEGEEAALQTLANAEVVE